MNSTDAIPLPKGTILNNQYRIIKHLAAGGFGVTYLAVSSRTVRSRKVQYVIKEHYPTWFSERDEATGNLIPFADKVEDYEWSLKSFRREASQLSVLNHLNIVKLITAFDEHDTAYYVMPFLEGGDLTHVIDGMFRHGVYLSQAAVLKLLRTMLRALEHMHGRYLRHSKIPIYHLDVKPANILLTHTADGTDVVPTLIDFGSPGMGSPEYMPHEQRREEGIGPWSDLYSLGATMHKLLLGEAPPSHLDEDLSPLPFAPQRNLLSTNPDLLQRYDQELLESIDRSLDWDPANRFSCAGDWLDVLQGIPLRFPDPGNDLITIVKTIGDDEEETEDETSIWPPILISLGTASTAVALAWFLLFAEEGTPEIVYRPDAKEEVSRAGQEHQQAELSRARDEAQAHINRVQPIFNKVKEEIEEANSAAHDANSGHAKKFVTAARENLKQAEEKINAARNELRKITDDCDISTLPGINKQIAEATTEAEKQSQEAQENGAGAQRAAAECAGLRKSICNAQTEVQQVYEKVQGAVKKIQEHATTYEAAKEAARKATSALEQAKNSAELIKAKADAVQNTDDDDFIHEANKAAQAALKHGHEAAGKAANLLVECENILSESDKQSSALLKQANEIKITIQKACVQADTAIDELENAIEDKCLTNESIMSRTIRDIANSVHEAANKTEEILKNINTRQPEKAVRKIGEAGECAQDAKEAADRATEQIAMLRDFVNKVRNARNTAGTCLDKMRQLGLQAKKTFVFISHSPHAGSSIPHTANKLFKGILETEKNAAKYCEELKEPEKASNWEAILSRVEEALNQIILSEAELQKLRQSVEKVADKAQREKSAQDLASAQRRASTAAEQAQQEAALAAQAAKSASSAADQLRTPNATKLAESARNASREAANACMAASKQAQAATNTNNLKEAQVAAAQAEASLNLVRKKVAEAQSHCDTLASELKHKQAKEQQENERLAREQQEKERLAREQQEKERLAREQQEKERLSREQQEKERPAREQQEKERLAREQQEKERLAREQQEKERLAREQQEKERLAREQQEKERLAREQQEKERLAREQQEKERLAREQQEKERLAREQQEKELNAVKRAMERAKTFADQASKDRKSGSSNSISNNANAARNAAQKAKDIWNSIKNSDDINKIRQAKENAQHEQKKAEVAANKVRDEVNRISSSEQTAIKQAGVAQNKLSETLTLAARARQTHHQSDLNKAKKAASAAIAAAEKARVAAKTAGTTAANQAAQNAQNHARQAWKEANSITAPRHQCPTISEIQGASNGGRVHQRLKQGANNGCSRCAKYLKYFN